MKKIILTTVLLSTSFLMGALTVHADDLSGKSTAKIGLTKQDPDHPVGPIDPLDPDDNPSSNQPTVTQVICVLIISQILILGLK